MNCSHLRLVDGVPIGTRIGDTRPVPSRSVGRAKRRAIRQTWDMTSDLLARIVVDPRICFGKPTIRGHRIWVSLILGHLAEGWSVDAIIDEFPGIEGDDIRACIAYGAQLADVQFADLDHVA